MITQQDTVVFVFLLFLIKDLKLKKTLTSLLGKLSSSSSTIAFLKSKHHSYMFSLLSIYACNYLKLKDINISFKFIVPLASTQKYFPTIIVSS